jgi:UTP--glucose-1-phosphate uridylyltransferase
MTKELSRALIPAAGLGNRLRPITRAIPKEMLPVGRKLVLEYILDELKEADIREVLIIISHAKEMIPAYFGAGSAYGMKIDYLYQPSMKGLGDAILCGEEWAGDDPFVVAFGDCITESLQPSSNSPLFRLIRDFQENQADAAVLTEEIVLSRSENYGIVAPLNEIPLEHLASFEIRDIVEKPAPNDAPSRFAVAARWVLRPVIFRYLKNAQPDIRGEINLTDSVRELLREKGIVRAVPLMPDERRRDIGGWDTYYVAFLKAMLCDPEVGWKIRRLIDDDVKD